MGSTIIVCLLERLTHKVVVCKVASRAQVAEKTADGDVLTPSRRVHCTRMDVLGAECSHELAQLGI
jgi:hypothetical protein